MLPPDINGNPTLRALSRAYDIRAELGKGATGTVYLAHDPFRDREVAIKVAHPHIFQDNADQALVRRAWMNEVRLAGQLRHPYIVEVFDAGTTADGAYLVMEYLPGGTLAQYIRPDTLKPLSEVLEIIFKCASALDYACRAGIIHRDIKPANLQYVGEGAAKVADFGAAYWSRDDSTQIMDIGSLGYMAPEVFRKTITPRADIYALGVTLYQLLSGRRPFDAKDQASLVYQIMRGEKTPLKQVRTDLPDRLDAFVERMMAADPDQRFPGWGPVLDSLGELMPGVQPTRERPAEAEMYSRLRALPLLSGFHDAEIWELLRISRWYKVAPGTVLVREGAEARSCYLLLEGGARVTQQGKLVNLLDPGTLFGELAFAEETPSPRAATVSADGEVTIGKWSYARLRGASPELQSKLLQIFFRLAAERLRQADERYHALYRRQRAAD